MKSKTKKDSCYHKVKKVDQLEKLLLLKDGGAKL